MTVVVGAVAEADAEAPLRDVLAAAVEANERLARLGDELRAENARLREELARRDAELERVNAELAVLQRLVFGRSSERARPDARGGGGDGNQDRVPAGGRGSRPRGPGARAGRRDYSHLPRVEVVWDFEGGGYCCPGCGEPFTLLGDHVVEQLDWQVTVRLVAHCRRRYRRACRCPVPATVMAPGPPKAIGKGLLFNGFIAMLLTERYVAGRSQNSLVTGLARHGAEVSAATLTGTVAAAGTLLAHWRTRSAPDPQRPDSPPW
jgi:transposase